MKCESYHESSYPNMGLCYSAKGMPICHCNGDRSKCDFYPEAIDKSNVTEVCPNCENEINMVWDIEWGFKAFCPVCGERLMLCSLCHDCGFDCDYDTESDSCKFNRAKKQ